MFVEDVILCALKNQSSWNVSEHLLRHENTSFAPGDLARVLADRHELRVETSSTGKAARCIGFRAWNKGNHSKVTYNPVPKRITPSILKKAPRVPALNRV